MHKEGMIPTCGLDSTDRIDQAVEATKLVLTEEESKYLEEPYLPKVGVWVLGERSKEGLIVM